MGEDRNSGPLSCVVSGTRRALARFVIDPNQEVGRDSAGRIDALERGPLTFWTDGKERGPVLLWTALAVELGS